MSRYLFDTETDGLYWDVTRIHCAEFLDIDSGNSISFTPDTIPQMLEFLGTLTADDILVGHNTVGFDMSVLEKLHGCVPKAQVIDTLLLSRLVWSDLKNTDFKHGLKLYPLLPGNLYGSHSLEAWGYRLGNNKGTFGKTASWESWSPEMSEYCRQDLQVTAALYRKILSKNYSQEAMDLEHRFATIIQKQHIAGFTFDVKKAHQLEAKLLQVKGELSDTLQELMPPLLESTQFIPKVNNSTKGWVKGVPVMKTKEKVFNPGSRDQIEQRFQLKYGWVAPLVKNKAGLMVKKIDDAVVSALPYPEAKPLAKYLMICKRLGQLSQGKEAWLKWERGGIIHGGVVTNGTATGRCSHSHPNVAQVPKVQATKLGVLRGLEGEYGYECRELFTVPKGWELVGADASGLELRCLAHYCAKYDGGEFGREVIDGDIHSKNVVACNGVLPKQYAVSRDTCKTLIYALLYGGGDAKLGLTVGGQLSDKDKITLGKKVRAGLFEGMPALKQLSKKVKEIAMARGVLVGLDGRLIPIRSSHAALNALLQCAGSILVKKATCMLYDKLETAGYKWGEHWVLVAHIHDEVQIQVRKGLGDEVGRIAVEAFREAGEYFKFRCATDGAYKVGANWAETH